MKKKLALLCLLRQDKPVYLLDEPFNSLDMESNKILEQIIHILKEKGKTIFVSSHIIDPLLKMCDEIHFLTNGNFARTYARTEFGSIEEDLFSKLKEDAKRKLSESI
jgi:ABC-2 type transport system ATP-binding protein